MPKNKLSLSKPAYDYLLNMIMSGRLLPGDRIPEAKIAQEFGISRTPIRDAMRILANDGLIEIFPHRFAQVAAYAPETIRDIGTLRISLDSMSIKLAMLYGSRSDFLLLQNIAARCEQGMLSGDEQMRRTADCDFHLELARITGNSLLLKFQKELYLRVQFLLLHQKNLVINEKRHIRQHFEITQALINQDEARALEIITDHLGSFYDLIGKYPEGFFHFPNPDLLAEHVI